LPVNSPCREYLANIEPWQRCRDAYEGSDAVKAQGRKYLPSLDSHKRNPNGYAEYVLRALYFNAMGRTVDGLAGSIFQKPPIWEVSEEVEDFIGDITLTGVTAEMFALRSTRNIMITGRWGILVDMGTAETEDKTPARPYFVGYKGEDIISWATELVGGDQRLTMVVLREFDDDPDPTDEFVRKQAEQYRVLRLSKGKYTQEIWSKIPNSESFVKGKTETPVRRGEALGFIPFVFMSAISIEPTIEKAPLLDLVDVNLSHYRTMADLEHGRHYTALPTPWVAGSLQGDEGGGDLSIGSGVAWMLDKGGSAGMLEFSGAGLQSLVTADQEKRKMMAILGARLLEDIGGAETATAITMRYSGDHATLRTIAAVLEQGFTKALKWVEWWVGTETTPEEVESEVKLNKDFFAAKAPAGDIQAALGALQAEQISYQTFYNILSEGGWAREGITYEQEREDISSDRKVNMEAAAEVQKAMAEMQAEAAPPEAAPAVAPPPDAGLDEGQPPPEDAEGQPDDGGDGGPEPTEEEMAAAEKVAAEAEAAGEELTEEEFYARIEEELSKAKKPSPSAKPTPPKKA